MTCNDVRVHSDTAPDGPDGVTEPGVLSDVGGVLVLGRRHVSGLVDQGDPLGMLRQRVSPVQSGPGEVVQLLEGLHGRVGNPSAEPGRWTEALENPGFDQQEVSSRPDHLDEPCGRQPRLPEAGAGVDDGKVGGLF